MLFYNGNSVTWLNFGSQSIVVVENTGYFGSWHELEMAALWFKVCVTFTAILIMQLTMSNNES